ncbi:hypothetical protein Nizo3893_2762 [Lactiplantibacillus plantarum]|nr:hypothetical protein Nizo2802_2049 [Lactiplantibacillus plantarum]KZU84860.1 hypothetical protein Nizo3893_2762 [Lactiplantibacillus plantarum]
MTPTAHIRQSVRSLKAHYTGSKMIIRSLFKFNCDSMTD